MRSDFADMVERCRKIAGYTQDELSDLIPVSTRQYQYYIKGTTPFDEDIVDRIAEVCDVPMLGLYFMKHCTKLGRKYMPDILPIQTIGDMMLNLDLSKEELDTVYSAFREIYRDKKLEPHEYTEYVKSYNLLDTVIGKLLPARAFALSVINNFDKNASERGYEEQYTKREIA